MALMRWRASMRRWLAPWSSLYWLRMNAALKRHKMMFDGCDGRADSSTPSLTLEQRKAIISNEPATIVVASAGSGKTAVVVAKVRYLLESGKAQPDEILLLAFNRAAAEEMRERCEALVGRPINAGTFHSVGVSILKAAGIPTRLSSLTENDGAFSRYLAGLIRALGTDPRFSIDLARLARFDRNPLFDTRDFASLADYQEAIAEQGELRTLDKITVKSRGEQDIANYLYLRGIGFSYERSYNTICPTGPLDYVPDFHITGTNIFIEFFGVDRRGRTAPGIDSKKYAEGMAWKREIHVKNGSILIELYSYQRSEGQLTEALEEALRQHKFEEKPRTITEVLAELNAPEWESEFSRRVSTFLTHYRSNNLSMREVVGRAQRLEGLPRERAKIFLSVFGKIEERYREYLASEQRIDFSEMIAGAARVIRAGGFVPPWKYIIVDEFQDISIGRYRLLERLLSGPKRPRLFAVGDDWQSINRFAGADNSIMTRADAYFHSPVMLFLSETFRFGQKLADVSSQFITRNPAQIPKGVRSQRPNHHVPCMLWWTAWTSKTALADIIRQISEAEDVAGRSLLILGRYQRFLPKPEALKALEATWKGHLLKPQTVHASKGLEADYVILLGVRDVIPRAKGGRLSLPATLSDDPLLALVMPNPDAFSFAEERRLMYVAMTRAKRRIDLVCHRLYPSVFADELAQQANVVSVGSPIVDIACPACSVKKRNGTIPWRRSGNLRCCNAECHFRLARCRKCENGILVPNIIAGQFRCSEAMCAGEPIAPP